MYKYIFKTLLPLLSLYKPNAHFGSSLLTANSQARKREDLPIYAVASEEFVSSASEVVLTLSSPPKETQAAAVHPSNLLGRVPHYSAPFSGARCAGRFSFLELPVERPVDLVLGSR